MVAPRAGWVALGDQRPPDRAGVAGPATRAARRILPARGDDDFATGHDVRTCRQKDLQERAAAPAIAADIEEMGQEEP